ncbi:unnamed protein product [Adineta ricciae]|uniref:Protein kinase domain-containing protein n=1 Tax=Adineta ricciae TaxID=249248 RepID=A0A813SIW7_ADIRI|nr:unnamed protein product [Adineta ricciae]
MFSKRPVHTNQTHSINGELYTLLSRIGHGSYGSVWKSVTPKGEYYAVKVFEFNHAQNPLASDDRLSSFKTEVKMGKKLYDETEHVVTMCGYEYSPRYGVGFIAMELGSESLVDRVRNLHQTHSKSPMFDYYDYISLRDQQNIWCQLVNIILALHQYGVIHRDLKPANLLFFGPTLKVIDFGMAQDEFVGFSPHQRIGGTRPYSAPECFTGQALITPKADVWSVGAILYYLTYGKAPVFESPRPPFGVLPTRSRHIQEILEHCLRPVASRRPDHQSLAQHPFTRPFKRYLK